MASRMAVRSEQGGLEELVVRRTHGKNLSTVMGDVLFKDLIACIQELVANSYDADAEKVTIRLDDYATRGISVTDDGTGMDLDGLHAFYNMGDSPKLQNNITEKGRRMIGKFGIASLVLRTLARHYVLVTERDGVQYKVEETLSDNDDDTKPIKVTKKLTEDTSHGTRIFMDKLRFLEDERNIDIGLLRRRLSVEMPASPDFTIWLNGDEIKPRVIERGIEYLIDIDDSLIGKVDGSIWYAPDIDEEYAGIYIKVHGKAVGGTNAELLGARFALANTVFGVINANGLEKIVGFDRDGFIKDHPRIKRLREHIHGIIKQISQDVKMSDHSEKIKKARVTIESLKPDIGEFVGSVMGTGEHEVVIDNNMQESDTSARLDADERRLHINPHSNHFLFSSYPRPEIILRRFYEAAKEAILREIVPDNKSKILDRLQEQANKPYEQEMKRLKAAKMSAISLTDIIGTSESEEEKIYRISPTRLYTESEISKATDLSLPVLRRAIDSGILAHEKDKILGQDVLDLTKRMKGYVTLFDAIRRIYPDVSPTNHNDMEVRINTRLQSFSQRGGLPHWIKNLAERRDFYIIEEKVLDSFKYFADNGEFPGKSNIVGERFYHYRDLSTGKGGSKGVVVYVIDIKVGDLEVVREAIKHETEFLDDEKQSHVKTVSYFANHGDRKYVVGILAGRVKDLTAGFESQGFKRADITGKAPSSLYIGVSLQRRQSSQLAHVKEFSDPIVDILRQIASAKQ